MMSLSLRLFQPVLAATLLLVVAVPLAGAPLQEGILLGQVDESLFRDSEEIKPNWWSESQGDDRTTLKPFLAWISGEIGQKIRYPSFARRHNQQGTVLVALRFGIDGALSSIEIAQSSGYEVLDLEAVRAIRAIEPASVPLEFRGVPVNAAVPIVFRLGSDEPPAEPSPHSR